jgi:hypothetical protein
MYCKVKISDGMLHVPHVHLTRPSIFIRDKPILSSERMLHTPMDPECKGSVENIYLVVILNGLDAKTN